MTTFKVGGNPQNGNRFSPGSNKCRERLRFYSRSAWKTSRSLHASHESLLRLHQEIINAAMLERRPTRIGLGGEKMTCPACRKASDGVLCTHCGRGHRKAYMLNL